MATVKKIVWAIDIAGWLLMQFVFACIALGIVGLFVFAVPFVLLFSPRTDMSELDDNSLHQQCSDGYHDNGFF